MTPPTIPDPPPDAIPTGIEAIYAEVRRLVGSAAEVEPPDVVDAAPGVVVVPVRTPTLPPAAHTNCYLIGEGEVVAVDPGSPFPDQHQALAAAVAERGRLVAVVLTHHHGDHLGGAADLAARTGAPIWAHAACAAALRGRLAVARHLEDGEVVEVGGRTLDVLHTPGHADGHVCLHDRGSGALVAGDMVAGIGTILIDPAGGHMATYLTSLERMLARDPGALLPAHGPVIADGPHKLREYLAHRRMREQRVEAALGAEPRSLGALCADAYADTPRLLWPLAERSLLAHLVKLVEDGRAVADEQGSWRRS